MDVYIASMSDDTLAHILKAFLTFVVGIFFYLSYRYGVRQKAVRQDGFYEVAYGRFFKMASVAMVLFCAALLWFFTWVKATDTKGSYDISPWLHFGMLFFFAFSSVFTLLYVCFDRRRYDDNRIVVGSLGHEETFYWYDIVRCQWSDMMKAHYFYTNGGKYFRMSPYMNGYHSFMVFAARKLLAMDPGRFAALASWQNKNIGIMP